MEVWVITGDSSRYDDCRVWTVCVCSSEESASVQLGLLNGWMAENATLSPFDEEYSEKWKSYFDLKNPHDPTGKGNAEERALYTVEKFTVL